MPNNHPVTPNLPIAYISCPTCGARVFLTAIWDSERPDKNSPYADIKTLADAEPKFWGGPKAKRVIIKECYSNRGPWIHFRVNGQDRLAYLKGRKPIRVVR